MFDVLVYLFENYYDSEFDPSQVQWARRLQSAGFEPDEIDEALDWLHELGDIDLSIYDGLADEKAGNRCYTTQELHRLDTECRGFLLFLENTEAVTPLQREVIIDRLMAFSADRVTVESLKLIALMVLWSQRVPMDMLLVEELLYTGRPLYVH